MVNPVILSSEMHYARRAANTSQNLPEKQRVSEATTRRTTRLPSEITSDPDLARVIAAWPTLPDSDRQSILGHLPAQPLRRSADTKPDTAESSS
jgi:hypothetical protein